jgi:hypothetical protein
MLAFELLREKGILIVKLQDAIEPGDFDRLAQTVDTYIGDYGALPGLMIEASSFPGWESFTALIEHLKFERDHNRQIRRVAVVTDSSYLKVAPRIAAHFAQPEFEVFSSAERARALAWLEGGSQ